MTRKPSLAARLARWHKNHGRHDLPWQGTRDPYPIWVSEIMLQQTQVAAVIPYFERFMARFPTVSQLAGASADEVMRHWSGLGYYSRARNLHAAAKIIRARHRGQFPRSAEKIRELPGIGRSTAAAIAAFAFGERAAILDGNVKRVLCRVFGVEGFPGERKLEKELWELAESLLPKSGIEIYTQALMDLGATLCARSAPQCERCPLAAECVAYRQGRTADLPTPRTRKAVPRRKTAMLILVHRGKILVEQRPPSGIWGGLWSLPEAPPDSAWKSLCRSRFGTQIAEPVALSPIRHGFTHFSLEIQPVLCAVQQAATDLHEPGYRWMAQNEIAEAALPAPVKRLLLGLERNRETN